MYYDPTGHIASDVTVGDVVIGNTQLTNGVTTGNLRDIVTGLGGTVNWNEDTRIATISMKNKATDQWVTISYDTNTMKDSYGNSFTIIDGRIQVGVRQMAQYTGVDDTISWWTNQNGTGQVVVRPEMKYAPVNVIREGNNVNITAYVNFTGDAQDLFPDDSGYTYAEVASAGIQTKWSGSYDVYGQNLTVRTKIYSNSYTPNGIWDYVLTSNKQRFMEFNINNGNNIYTEFGMRSHTYTETLQIPTLSGKVLTFDNIPVNPHKWRDTLINPDPSGDNSRFIWDWSIQNPGRVVMHNRYKGVSIDATRKEYSSTSAHEFGHILGIGDAYPAEYRESGVPDLYYDQDDIGKWIPIKVNKDADSGNADMMYWGQRVSNIDIMMMLEAWAKNKPSIFPTTQSIDAEGKIIK